MKRLLTAAVAGLLALGLASAALAMTPDEAKTTIRQQAVGKGLDAKDVSQAVSTLEQLIAKGVPVEHAYDVVKAAIDGGVRGTDLAAIARKTPSQAQMKEDIASPTRGEFGRGGPGGAGHDFGANMGGAMSGRRP